MKIVETYIVQGRTVESEKTVAQAVANALMGKHIEDTIANACDAIGLLFERAASGERISKADIESMLLRDRDDYECLTWRKIVD